MIERPRHYSTPIADARCNTEVLRVDEISKRFGATRALAGATVSFASGEVHALMGENGAGKSTLGKVIAGLHRQDSGVVSITDATGQLRPLAPGSIDDSFNAGIRIVHQELAQCPNLSVAENLCLHALPRTRMGLVDRKTMESRAAQLLDRLDPGINPRALLGSLGPGRRQIVQIAASLDIGDHSAGEAGTRSAPRVIVFDEPTSSLSIAEVERLLEIIRGLRAQMLTCIYVSHRMGEIFAVCDRVTVLRDGALIGTSRVKDIDEGTLVEQMVGRKVEISAPRRVADPAGAAAALEVTGLSSPGIGGTPLHDVSLTVAPGEIVGIGGLVGAGRSELLDAIFGLDPHARGEIRTPSGPLMKGTGHPGAPAAIRAGLGYLPEDRKLQGLFFQLGVGENIIMPLMARLAAAPGLRGVGRESSEAAERLRKFHVKTAGESALPGTLSGGNQQKLLAARWMGRETKVLMLDEPTRGIDVGAKDEIHRLIREAADQGLAVLLVSSEMPELLALSDRILVLADGRLTGELRGDERTQTSILRLATAVQSKPALTATDA